MSEPAVLLHQYDIDVIEEVANPRNAFVTTSELVKYTGYSRDTVRRRMENLTNTNIVVDHGDISSRTGDYVDYLYMPADTDPETLFTRLHEQDGRTPPADLTNWMEVVPSEFDHVEEDIFEYTGGQDIVIDVDQPNRKINSKVVYKLYQVGLTPTDSSNFTYQPRRRAGLF